MKKFGLLIKVIIATLLGVVIGLYAPVFFVRILATFNGIFSNFLNFVVPLLIMGFVISGISDLGGQAGKLLAITASIAYASTILFGTGTFFIAKSILPKFIKSGSINFNPTEFSNIIKPFFESPMEPVFDVTTALILSFILGVGIAVVKADMLKKAIDEFSDIINKLISNIIIPLLPIHICGIFAKMAAEGTVATLFSVFSKVFVMVIILHWITIAIQYFIASLISRANFVHNIKNIFPAYMTALGTQSSASTIPVTLQSTYQMGVEKRVADFVIPLCSTIHLSGSTITLLSCSIAILLLNGEIVTFTGIFPFILMLGVTMVAAPGVPGGAVMASLGILKSILGYTDPMIALIIALYTAQDSFGTACNITGDGAIALIVNKISGFNLDPENNKKYITILK